VLGVFGGGGEKHKAPQDGATAPSCVAINYKRILEDSEG